MNYKLLRSFNRVMAMTAEIKPLNDYYSGLGAILMLHRVHPMEMDKLAPNEGLKVSPQSLEKLIIKMKQQGFEFISLDQLHDILTQKKNVKKQVVFTLDDGYKDNLLYGFPIFKKHEVPFAVYVTSSLPEKRALLWWYVLEDILLANDSILLGNGKRFDCASKFDKVTVFMKIRESIIKMEKEDYENRLKQLFSNYDVDWESYCDKLALNWSEVRELSNDPLVTIGSHTHNHFALNRLTESEVRNEVQMCDSMIESRIEKKIEHFCYPFGGVNEIGQREIGILEEMGYKTATTTRNGTIYHEHAEHLQSLPRIFVTESFRPSHLGQIRKNKISIL